MVIVDDSSASMMLPFSNFANEVMTNVNITDTVTTKIFKTLKEMEMVV
jgi:hypothetical protein